MLISDSKNSANDELSDMEDRDIKPTDIELKVTVTSTLIAKNFQNDFKYSIVLDLLRVLISAILVSFCRQIIRYLEKSAIHHMGERCRYLGDSYNNNGHTPKVIDFGPVKCLQLRSPVIL